MALSKRAIVSEAAIHVFESKVVFIIFILRVRVDRDLRPTVTMKTIVVLKLGGCPGWLSSRSDYVVFCRDCAITGTNIICGFYCCKFSAHFFVEITVFSVVDLLFTLVVNELCLLKYEWQAAKIVLHPATFRYFSRFWIVDPTHLDLKN